MQTFDTIIEKTEFLSEQRELLLERFKNQEIDWKQFHAENNQITMRQKILGQMLNDYAASLLQNRAS